jgi:molecular chaperone GrpE (heat shock protein)
MDSMEAVIGAIRPPRPPRRPGLPRRQRYALLAKLASDAHALSAALESAAATQAAIADMLTGKARDLRREVRESRRKLAEASRAVEGMQGSMATVRRDNEDLRERLAEKDEKIAELQSEYKRLRESGASDARTNIDDERRQLFNDLSQMLVQWPTVRNAIETGRDVKGRDLVGMLSRIDATFSRLGFETIGAVDAAVEFDERLHQPAGTADRVPVKGERVTVRFVGYRYKGEILRKAQVLPG